MKGGKYALPVLAGVLFVGSTSVPSEAHTVAMSDLPEGCRTGLNSGAYPVDMNLGEIPAAGLNVTAPGFNEADQCNSYTWIAFTTHNSKHLTGHYGININTADVDCVHSSLAWGLYWKPNAFYPSWTWMTGGVSYGKLVNGVCTYDPENPPHGTGYAFTNVPLLGNLGLWRLAVKSWQHDDVNLGHSGVWCGGLPQCNHETNLTFTP